jgi:hypothetical protein
MSRSLVLASVLLVGYTDRGGIRAADFPAGDPMNKELAKARFEASQASTVDVARARTEALRAAFEDRYQHFLADMGGALGDLLRSFAQLEKAEVEAAASPAGRLAVLEASWQLICQVADLVRAEYEAGRVKATDYLELQRQRLAAEIRFLQSRARVGPHREPVPDDRLSPLEGDRLSAEKERARRKYAASKARVADLQRARVETAWEEAAARYPPSRPGLCWTENLLGAIAEARLVEYLAEPSLSRRRAHLEASWRAAWEVAQEIELDYSVGRVLPAAYYDTRWSQLQAEVRLAQEKAGLASPGTLQWGVVEGFGTPPLKAKEVARARFAVARANLPDLTRRRAEVNRRLLDEIRKDFRSGKKVERLLEPYHHALAALDLAPAGAPEKIAALVDYWTVTWLSEQERKAGYESGRVKAADYYESRAARLEAQVRLAEARAAKEKTK